MAPGSTANGEAAACCGINDGGGAVGACGICDPGKPDGPPIPGPVILGKPGGPGKLGKPDDPGNEGTCKFGN